MTESFNVQFNCRTCSQTNQAMQLRALRTIETAMVVRNWLFGWYMVKYEQNGSDRAQYGTRLVSTLSEALKRDGVKGVSITSLKQFRNFYLLYKEKSQTVSDLSVTPH